MTCEEIRERLAAYHGSELDRDAAGMVRSHLGECRACREQLARFERGWSALDLLEDLPAPLSLRRAVAENIRRDHRRRLPARILSAAAAVVLVIGAVLYWQTGTKEETAPVAVLQEETVVRASIDPQAVNEEEIIRDLPLLREKEFFDSIDVLRKIDYLPLVDEQRPDGRPRSSLIERDAA